MQPYQPNSIELRKQQVRKNSRNTAIALGVTVVSLPLAFWAASSFIVLAILAGLATVYYGLTVRKGIKGPDSPRGQIGY